MSDLSACMSSQKQDWRTPAIVLDRVRMVAPIGLDPCSDGEGSLVDAGYRFVEAQDGLARKWSSFVSEGCLTYCNPPYSGHLPAWTEKCRVEGEDSTVIALVPARTDTRWWRHVESARAVAFWRGRIRFEGGASCAPFPSALAIWSPRFDHVERFVEAFRPVAGIWRAA